MAEILVRNGFPLYLERNERKLLSQMVTEDVRTPADQVRWLIVEEAKRRGLLPAPKNANGGAMDLDPQRAAVPNSRNSSMPQNTAAPRRQTSGRLPAAQRETTEQPHDSPG